MKAAVLLFTADSRSLTSLTFFFHFSAWIGSIAFGMMFLCGPIASTMCQKYGCRTVSAIGGLIGLLGLLLTSFTNSIYVIYLTYSVLWGFGSSLNYAPTMLVLGKLNVLILHKSLLLFCIKFKETVVPRRWGSCTQKFGFINGVDNIN